MNDLNYPKIINRMQGLCIGFLICAVILNMFGVEVFVAEVNNERLLEIFAIINQNFGLRAVINIIKGIVSINLMFAFVIADYKQKLIKINTFIIIYLFVINLGQFWSMDIRVKGLIVFSGYLFPLIHNCKVSTCVKLAIVDTLYLSLILILLDISFLAYSDNVIYLFIIAVDYLALWAITYFNKKEIKKWGLFLERGLALWVTSPKKLETASRNLRRLFEQVQTARKLSISVTALTSWRKNLKFYIKFELLRDLKSKVIPTLIVLSVYLGFAVIMGVVDRAIYTYIAYLSLYNTFPKHFHADFIPGIKRKMIRITCICLSSLTFCIMVYNTLLLQTSVLSTIFIAFIVDFILFVFRDWLDFKKWYNREERLRKELTDLGFTFVKVEIAVRYGIHGLPMHDVANSLGYSEQVCRNYFRDICKVRPELKRKKK